MKGKAVVLAAGSGETVRILLNSKSNAFPNGSPTPAGWSASTSWTPSAPACARPRPGAGKSSAAQRRRRGRRPLLFPLVALQGAEGRQARFRPRLPHRNGRLAATCPAAATRCPTTCRKGSYGTKFKEDARRYYGSFVGFAARGEMIPNENCYADLDPTRERQVRHPRPPLPLEVERARDEPGDARGEDLRRPDRSDGRHRPQQPRRQAGDRASRTPAASSTKSAARSSATTRRSPSATSGTRPGT